MSEPGTSGRALSTRDLRVWFAFYLAWMGLLTAAALLGLRAADAGSRIGMATWLLAGYAFYLSLCCTFFPGPTTGIVMLLASDYIAQELGIAGHGTLRLIVVATVGALATGLANLNEYHIFSYLLRFGRVARVRDTRAYRSAARWFERSPFLVIAGASLIPIPVDVVRWLAIGCRYPRMRYFAAYFMGRWIRYAGWAVASIGLGLGAQAILVIQIGLITVAAARVLAGMLKRPGAGSDPAGQSRVQSGVEYSLVRDPGTRPMETSLQ